MRRSRFDAVHDLIGRGAVERVTCIDISAHGFDVAPRRHVGLAEPVVRELEDGIELDGPLELPRGFVEALRLQRVLSEPQMCTARLPIALLGLATVAA